MSRAAAKKTGMDLKRALRRASEGERVVVKRGKKGVAVVPIEDLRLLQKLEDEEDLRDAREALKEAKEKGTIPWEKVKAELGLS